MTEPTIKNAADLSRVVGDILDIYLTGDGGRKSEMGIACVRQVSMTQCATQLLGPGVSIRTMDGKEYHIAVVPQPNSGWVNTAHCGD